MNQIAIPRSRILYTETAADPNRWQMLKTWYGRPDNRQFQGWGVWRGVQLHGVYWSKETAAREAAFLNNQTKG